MDDVKEIVTLKQVVKERKDLLFSKANSSLGMGQALMKEIGSNSQEHLVVCCINTKMDVTHYSVVHVGATSMSVASPSNILQRALLSNSTGILISHNHPSNNCRPSENDKDFTERLIDSCEIFGIRFVDHIIVGESNYFSFREEGLLKSDN